MVTPKEYVLSICIPTYNRAPQLRQFLRSLLPQIPPFQDYVGVFISDNASTDETENMVHEMVSHYNVNITYHRKSEHTDRFGNYSSVLSLSQSRYVFMSGDDDIMAPNFLQTIMPYLLSNEEFGLVHWNYIASDDTCQRFCYLRHSIYNENDIISAPDFIQTTIDGADFLSSTIYNRKILDVKFPDQNFDGGGYRHFYRILRGALQLNLRCVYYSFPLCIQRNPTRANDSRLPYYLFVDKGKIWRNLDKFVPGVYDEYKKGISNLPEQYILNISKDRSFYREHEREMMEYLVTREQKELFQMVLTATNLDQALRWRNIKNIFFKQINKIIRKLAKNKRS